MPSRKTPTAGDLEKTREQLRAEIREARETLKDLHAATKNARQLAPALVTSVLQAEVERQLGLLGEHTERAMDESVKRVVAKFDELYAVMTGQDHATRRSGQMSIPDLLAERAKRMPCAQHPTAPVIGGACGGCTVYPSDMEKER
ncbi:hypothetical protein ACIQRE_01890 [Streptomyces griseoluteus]|uniref:hypothetical protein n=1 Tax=Streptomyces griseoluteus TaxID=29306 RepID=UPI003827801B